MQEITDLRPLPEHNSSPEITTTRNLAGYLYLLISTIKGEITYKQKRVKKILELREIVQSQTPEAIVGLLNIIDAGIATHENQRSKQALIDRYKLHQPSSPSELTEFSPASYEEIAGRLVSPKKPGGFAISKEEARRLVFSARRTLLFYLHEHEQPAKNPLLSLLITRITKS